MTCRLRPTFLIALMTVVATVVTTAPRPAGAIPPFARKYRISCSMCHQPAPRLTAFGEAFAANGFELVRGEPPRDTIDTGDPTLRLPAGLPLGVRVDLYQRLLSKKAAGDATVDQQLPWTVKLLSGGQVTDNISYYMYLLISERGEVAGLEDAYVQFTDIGGSGVSVIAGQFQVSDPLFKRELRLAYEDYQVYRVRVGDARADLTYDRGLMAMWSPRDGTDLTLEVVNGRGLDPASGARQYDTDSDKNFALRLSQEMGTMRVGAFGYAGDERGNGVVNRIRVFGPDATVAIGANTELNVQLLRRWDSDPFYGRCSPTAPCPGGAQSPFSTTVDAALAEVTYAFGGPAGRWFLNGVYNYVDGGAPVVALRLGEQNEEDGFLTRYRAGVLGLHYLLKRNVRLSLEGGWNADREQARLTTGLTVGF